MAEQTAAEAFKQLLDADSIRVFNEACDKPYAEQATFFLNAFWVEHGDQAEAIYSLGYKTMCAAEMEAKGIMYVHMYDEGNELDIDSSLRFFEMLCNRSLKERNHKEYCGDWEADPKYAPGLPAMMTSIKRKRELKQTVDVNGNGKICFLEYLIYQYKCDVKDLMTRVMSTNQDEDEGIRLARLALEEVQKAIKAYEAEKQRLTDLAETNSGKGIKALKAKNMLAQLDASPLKDHLNMSLIKAEAALRRVTREAKARGAIIAAGGEAKQEGGAPMRTDGTMWWMQRTIQEAKEKYGR